MRRYPGIIPATVCYLSSINLMTMVTNESSLSFIIVSDSFLKRHF